MFNQFDNGGCNLGAVVYNENQEQRKALTVNNLLDAYNSNMYLYEQFGEEKYLVNAKLIMTMLNMGEYVSQEVAS